MADMENPAAGWEYPASLPELYQAIHPYPIRGDLNRQAAKLAALDRIANNPVVRLVKALRGGRK